MKDQESMHLKSEHFSENISSSLKEFQDLGEFSDVTLVCEGGVQVKAHRIILAASSGFFKSVLTNQSISGIYIYLRGIAGNHLKSLVNFIYQGEVNVHREELEEFLKLASELEVTGLSDQNQELAINNGGRIPIVNVSPPIAEKSINQINHKIKHQKTGQQQRQLPNQYRHYNTKTRINIENMKQSLLKTHEEQNMHQLMAEQEPVVIKPELVEPNEAADRPVLSDMIQVEWTEQERDRMQREVSRTQQEVVKGQQEVGSGKREIKVLSIEQDIVHGENWVRGEEALQKTVGVMMEKVGGIWMCKGCGEKCEFRQQLKEHVEEVHVAGVKHICSICGKIFKSRSFVRNHINRFHQF